MIEFIENVGLWIPGIIAILCGMLWSISLSHSRGDNEEKTNFKIIIGNKEEKREKEERKAA